MAWRPCLSPLRGSFSFYNDPGAARFALAPGYLLAAPAALQLLAAPAALQIAINKRWRPEGPTENGVAPVSVARSGLLFFL
jgi:hypothetical protein